MPPTPLGRNCRVVVYGETPGEEEVLAGAGFVGRAGRQLRKCERQAGLDVPWPVMNRATWQAMDLPKGGEAAHANVVLCRPPRNEWPGGAVAQECWTRHKRYHQEVVASGLPIVAAGRHATDWFTGYNLGIMDTAGTLLPVREELGLPPLWVVSTLHPSFLIRGGGDEEKAQDALVPLLTFSLVKALAGTTPKVPKVRFVEAGTVAAQLATSDAELVAVDIEGQAPPVIVGFSWKPWEAWVCWWGNEAKGLLADLFRSRNRQVVLHNAAFDLVELLQEGVAMPDLWVDTIVLAGVFDAGLPLNLQNQTLVHVPGTVAWKGLVDHRLGPTKSTPLTGLYSELHEKAGGRWGGWEGRYAYYNGMDTAGGTLPLALALRDRLGHRMAFYREVHQPLQRPLLELGLRGIPVDVERRVWWRARAQRVEAAARRACARYGRGMLEAAAATQRAAVEKLENQRAAEQAAWKEAGGKGRPAFSGAKRLTSERNKLKTREAALAAGFNVDSPLQRLALLKDWYGLPMVVDRKTKGYSTNEKALVELRLKLDQKKAKPKRGTVGEVEKALHAIEEGKKWATWRRAYLGGQEEGDAEQGEMAGDVDGGLGEDEPATGVGGPLPT